MRNKLERLKELRREVQNGKYDNPSETKSWSDAPHHTAIRVGSEADVLERKRNEKSS